MTVADPTPIRANDGICQVIEDQLMHGNPRIVWPSKTYGSDTQRPSWTGRVKVTGWYDAEGVEGATSIEVEAGTPAEVFAEGAWRVTGTTKQWFSNAETHLDRDATPTVADGPFVMLCGGFVLYAALKANRITEDTFVPGANARVAAELLADVKAPHTTIPLRPGEEGASWQERSGQWSGAMLRGNIVIWVNPPGDDTGQWNHIAVATGSGDDVYSLWETDNTPDVPVRVPVPQMLSLRDRPTAAIKILTPFCYAKQAKPT